LPARVIALDVNDAVRYLLPVAQTRTERTIRRYRNRKLYDATAGAYVTLDALGEMVGRGERFRVVDQASGDDISSLVLAQVMLESIKEKSAQVPRGVLERLIAWSRPLKGALHAPQEAAGRAKDEVQRIVADLLGRGRLSLEEAITLRQEVASAVQAIVSDAQRSIEGTLGAVFQEASPAKPSEKRRRAAERRTKPKNEKRAKRRRTKEE
jgi:polyhydroxyalkanoate synthesis repressor PhaR